MAKRLTAEEEKSFVKDMIKEEGMRCVEQIAKCKALELEGPLELMYMGMVAMASGVLNHDYERIIQFCEETANAANEKMIRELPQEEREIFQRMVEESWQYMQNAASLELDEFERQYNAPNN